mmetsp:Transcript_100157/g.122575  ORF Transcript_100157/g.122575 Transcript_100157/m.122575 type:complete len:137 (+) Transcript_100157:331-741(+)
MLMFALKHDSMDPHPKWYNAVFTVLFVNDIDISAFLHDDDDTQNMLNWSEYGVRIKVSLAQPGFDSSVFLHSKEFVMFAIIVPSVHAPFPLQAISHPLQLTLKFVFSHELVPKQLILSRLALNADVNVVFRHALIP